MFASVSQAEPHQAGAGQEGQGLPGSEPGRPRVRARKPKRRPDASPENAEDTLRIKAEAARIAAEVFAVIPQVSRQSLCTCAMMSARFALHYVMAS